jgi:hypothetical protein
MPIHEILCPDCGHRFTGMVFAGTRVPELWHCSQCGGEGAMIDNTRPPAPHPLETVHGGGCPCCGGAAEAHDPQIQPPPSLRRPSPISVSVAPFPQEESSTMPSRPAPPP